MHISLLLLFRSTSTDAVRTSDMAVSSHSHFHGVPRVVGLVHQLLFHWVKDKLLNPVRHRFLHWVVHHKQHMATWQNRSQSFYINIALFSSQWCVGGLGARPVQAGSERGWGVRWGGAGGEGKREWSNRGVWVNYNKTPAAQSYQNSYFHMS